MVRVYKTTIQKKAEADTITELLLNEIPTCDISFDLDDCDNVLRVETQTKPVDDIKIRGLVKATGHHIEELPY